MKTIVIRIIGLGLVLTALCAGMTACTEQPDRETITQYSTIDALMNGLYDGVVSFSELEKYGDTSIGTVERLDGEMLALDGRYYQIKADGKAYRLEGSAEAPFAVVTFFDTDQKLTIPDGADCAGLEEFLDSQLPTANIFYVLKIEGTFSYMKTRAIPAQSKPYPKLLEASQSQAVFEFNDVEGTLVGFRSPAYVSGVNVPGYHLHFLNKAKDAGGHVLDFQVTRAEASIDYTSKFELVLPGEDTDFYRYDFTQDQTEDLQKVEK